MEETNKGGRNEAKLWVEMIQISSERRFLESASLRKLTQAIVT